MLVLPNMGLVKWESLNDNFSHEQLAANWQLMDEHDHTSGKGKQIPFGGLAEGSVGYANLRSDVIEKVTTGVVWYTPKYIATEQTRESTSFGTMATADEIPNVEVPLRGIIGVGYTGLFKSSVSGAGRVTLFIGSNQIKAASGAAASPPVFEASSSTTVWTTVESNTGLFATVATESFVTTGQSFSGFAYIFGLPAGKYNLSMQYRATSGNVTAKERTLSAMVFGH